jgi:hypothetical protein
MLNWDINLNCSSTLNWIFCLQISKRVLLLTIGSSSTSLLRSIDWRQEFDRGSDSIHRVLGEILNSFLTTWLPQIAQIVDKCEDDVPTRRAPITLKRPSVHFPRLRNRLDQVGSFWKHIQLQSRKNSFSSRSPTRQSKWGNCVLRQNRFDNYVIIV